MNEPMLFLLGAVALSALGGLIVWILSRPRRERFGSTIDTFSKDLSALAPPGASRKGSSAKPQTRGARPAATGGRPGPRPTVAQRPPQTVPGNGGRPAPRSRPGPRQPRS